MNRRKTRRRRPHFDALQARLSPAVMTPLWVGQANNQDYAGLVSGTSPNDYVDAEIALANLSMTADQVTKINFSRNGGGFGESYTKPGGGFATFIPAKNAQGQFTNAGSLFFDVPASGLNGQIQNIDVFYNNGSAITDHLNDNPLTYLTISTQLDPNKRVPGKQLSIQWLSQESSNPQDWTGPTAGVGPDGIQDFHVKVANISADGETQSVLLTSNVGQASQTSWEGGTNTYFQYPFTNKSGVQSGEVMNRTGSTADFYGNPVASMVNSPLSLHIVYTDQNRRGKTDTATTTTNAMTVDANKAMTPLSASNLGAATVISLAQDTADNGGNSYVQVTGVPAGETLASVQQAVLTDQAGGIWAYPSGGTTPYTNGSNFYRTTNFNGTANADGLGLPMQYDSSTGKFKYPPFRDEAGSQMTIRLVFTDGAVAVARFSGVASDINRRGFSTTQSQRTAMTVHDAAGLVAAISAKVNDITLVPNSSGVKQYALSQPLRLDYNASLKAAASDGISLVFTTDTTTQNGWSDLQYAGAINIGSSQVSLDGFGISFTTNSSSWSNARRSVIYLTATGNQVGLGFKNLSIQSPRSAIATPSGEEAINLLGPAQKNSSGTISGNTLTGGELYFEGGPWTITNNKFMGSQPNSFVRKAIHLLEGHDIAIQSNTFGPIDDSAEINRVFNSGSSSFGRGINNDFSGNTITGKIGQKFNHSEPEVITSEQYLPFYEGTAWATSADRYILTIPYLRGIPATTGDVVSVLSGPDVGKWFRITQALSGTQYLLDSPLPAAAGSTNYAISISRGWINDTYTANSIDLSASSGGNDAFFLQGSRFGTKVTGNTIKGLPFLIYSSLSNSASEQDDRQFNPGNGWTHLPVFDLNISGNTFQDAPLNILLNHEALSRAGSGRDYLKGSLSNNAFLWTSATQPGYTIGIPTNPNSIDPYVREPDYTHANFPWLDDGELDLIVANNWGSGPASASASLKVIAATIRDASGALTPGPVEEYSIPLPTSPTLNPTLTATAAGATAVNLNWTAVAGATGYIVERSLNNTNWAPVGQPLPSNGLGLNDTGLSPGTTYYYRVHATSSGGSSPYGSAMVTTPGGSSFTSYLMTPFLAINAGGGTTTLNSETYYGDGSATTPSFAITGSTNGGGGQPVVIDTTGVTNAAPQVVYQTNRYATNGSFAYTISGLTVGRPYDLRLHFAETFVTTAGARQFNVAVNGNPVLTNFDIFAAAGGANKAVVRQMPANADANGNISVTFTNGAAQTAQVNGIELFNRRPTAGDYDGDGKADLATFDTNTGLWQIQYSLGGTASFTFGQAGDIPVPADYLGDGITDVAVYRPGNGSAVAQWFINKNHIYTGSITASIINFGTNASVPVPADYNGDGKADIGTFFPTSVVVNGSPVNWLIATRLTPNVGQGYDYASQYNVRFGQGTGDVLADGKTHPAQNDIPVPADYQATGQANLAVYRRGLINGWAGWLIDKSHGAGDDGSNFAGPIYSGNNAGIPVPADYTGDGAADIAVYFPIGASGDGKSQVWWLSPSLDLVVPPNTPNNVLSGFGAGGPIRGTDAYVMAVPADYNGDGKADIANFYVQNRNGYDWWYAPYSGNNDVGPYADALTFSLQATVTNNCIDPSMPSYYRYILMYTA